MTTPPAAPLRVLIVEDEESIRALLGDILLDLGHAPVAVADGAAALATLARDPGAVDLAIIDWVLPSGEDGIDTLRTLRRARPGLAAIVSSGRDDTAPCGGGTLAEIARAERCTTLRKPYKVDTLERAIADAMAAARGP